jgi:uncharacterized membrane protein
VKKLGTILFVAASVAYPFLVLAGMLVFKAPPRALALVLVAVVLLNFLANGREARKPGFGRIRLLAVSGIVAVLVVLIMVTDSAGLVKLYPVLMNLFLLGSFGWTVLRPPVMIFRFAQLQDKGLAESSDRPRVEQYCRTVTLVWCGFFALNAAVAAFTAFAASDLVWSVYNGLVSYILIGVLLVGEMIVRRFFQKPK